MLNLLHRNPIWPFFIDITKIPRPSKHEEQMVAYLVSWAHQHNVSVQTDSVGNVLYSIPATSGCEDSSPITLQAHIDMVCEKNANVNHDFLADPIPAYVDGNWLRSHGTTLGADDGIGVATALAIISEGQQGRLAHAPLYCLFTVDEETGLTGAYNVKPEFLPSSQLINLDSEDEGQIFIGCAGGCTTTAQFELLTEPTPAGMLGIKITLGGLLGGHSGGDIHLGRANALKLMARFVALAADRCDLRLASFNAGNLHNAIAREALVEAAIPMAQKENLRVEFNVFLSSLHEEYDGIEPNIDFDFETTDCPISLFTSDLQNRFIGSLLACPHGVLAMHPTIAALVQTSTNLASVRTSPAEGIRIVTSQRSSAQSGIEYASQAVAAAFKLAKAKVLTNEGYPGWSPNLHSPILHKAVSAYQKLFQVEPQVLAIHAGLECGLFASKKQGMDMISVGPTLRAVHSPDEAVDIDSVDKFWSFIKELVK